MLRSAAIGLGLLGDKSIVPDLVIMLADAQGQAPQAAIASALGFIGDSRSVDPLLAFMEDKQKSDGARGFAAAALGIVADKEPLPWNSEDLDQHQLPREPATLTSPATEPASWDIL
jgi:HEAT repeat protein